jgi:hypothetical protein
MADNAAVGNNMWTSDSNLTVSNPNNAMASDQAYTLGVVGATGCFLAGTKITIKDGYENIENIIPGDFVLSYNPDTKKQKLVKVLKVFKHHVKGYVVLETQNKTVFTTVVHPFLTTKGWKLVEELKIGDQLVTDSGNETITKLEDINKVIDVYNLEVENPHTYYANGFVVHNKPGANFTTVKLVDNTGTIVGNNNATGALHVNIPEAYNYFGSSSDLWGLSLTPAIVNNANFGVVVNFTGSGYGTNSNTHYLEATNFGFVIPGSATINGIYVRIQGYEGTQAPYGYAYIDYISMTVYYTP